MPRRTCLLAFLGLLGGLVPVRARAHALTITQVLVSFDQPGTVDVKMDIDLTNLMSSPEAYYDLSQAKAEAQQAAIGRLLPGITNDLQVRVGPASLALIFQGFTLPALSKSDYLDPTVDHFTTLRFLAVLPASRDPIRLVVRPGARIDYPVAFIVQIPSAHISEASWIGDESEDSDEFDWVDVAPKAGATQVAAPAAKPAPGATAAPGAPATPAAPEAPVVAPRRNEPTFDVDALPWPHQLSMYLRLGFHHIVPEGTDHILFVLGLFFLGITWRKLLSQTTVFTLAHATTLFLSTYGIFRLPSHIVEPAIALSIAYIALENVFSPRLGVVGRLAVVFLLRPDPWPRLCEQPERRPLPEAPVHRRPAGVQLRGGCRAALCHLARLPPRRLVAEPGLVPGAHCRALFADDCGDRHFLGGAAGDLLSAPLLSCAGLSCRGPLLQLRLCARLPSRVRAGAG